MEWIISYTNSQENQVNEALRETGRVEWRYVPQTKNIAVGDTVFLYENTPEKRIRWKCEVTETDGTGTGPDKYFPDDDQNEHVFALEPFYEYISPEGLRLGDLVNNGCWKIIRGPFRLEVIPQLEEYIHEVDGREVAVSEKLPLKKLEELAEKYVGHSPRQYPVTEKRYARSPFVAEWVKRRANGICELCGKPAPFRDRRGRPYLEVHHVKPLAEGGEDSVKNAAALCPNCHRKMHSLCDREDVDRLTALAGKE